MKVLTHRKKIAIHAHILQSVKKKKNKKPINSNTNYCREMNFIPIDVDYCLLQFAALIFFSLGSVYMGGGASLFNFYFFQCKPPNRKVHYLNCLDTNFHNFSGIILRIVRREL